MRNYLSFMLFMSVSFVLSDPLIALDSSIMPDRHCVQGTGPIETFMTDGVVYSQPYNWGEIDNGVSITNDRRFCDDFELDDDCYVTDIYVWTMWTGAQASVMNLVISEDDTSDSDPNTNTSVWSESVPCINTFTGDSNWGYDIYETHCVIN